MGTLLAILTDQGKEVDGQVIREVCRLLDIEKQHTCTYKASTNGQVKRLHRTLNGMMGRAVTDNQIDWDLWVPYIMAAYRSTRQESSQYSPNYLMFNRETRCGVDLLYDTMPVNDGQSSTYARYVEEMTDRRRAAYQLVRQHLAKLHEGTNGTMI